MRRQDLSGTVRNASVAESRCYGIGIGNASEHGIVMVDGYPIGPGSPLILDGSPCSVAVALQSFYQGRAELLVATCPADVPGLCRARAPYWARFTGTTVAEATSNVLIPFNGRARFYGVLRWNAPASSSIDVTTSMRHYKAADGSFDVVALNAYDETDFPEESSNDAGMAFEETERGDELVIGIVSDGAVTYSLTAWAHDEGT